MCPLEAIQIETAASIDQDRCGRCGACIAVCPEGAIDWAR
jgi:heterodisulfide reductase subunit A-like polyferredoxin